MNYTKGEWQYEEELLANMSMISCGDSVIAGIPNDVSGDKGAYLEQVANATLIAAAPDMYEKLEELMKYCYGRSTVMSDDWGQLALGITKVLAKAEGKGVNNGLVD